VTIDPIPTVFTQKFVTTAAQVTGDGAPGKDEANANDADGTAVNGEDP